MAMTEDLHKCNMGDHDLIEIANMPGDEMDEVVRWCKVCGSVVVDLEIDGRLYKPGGAIKMMSPKISDDAQIYYE